MEKLTKIRVRAKILPDHTGGFRIWVQRAPRKWWRELGTHEKSDTAFWTELQGGGITWLSKPKQMRLPIY